MIDVKLPKTLQPVSVSEMVRVGQRGDGGYVIDKDLIEKTDILVGLGLGFDWSFEKDFLRRAGGKISVHGYDHTIGPKLLLFHSIKNVLFFLLLWRKYCFSISFLFIDYILFFGKKNVRHFRERVHWRSGKNIVSVRDIFDRTREFDNIFLKMDIEGSEYEILDDVIENENIIGMAIEFHNLNLLEDRFLSAIQSIKTKFIITHLHVNNGSDIGRNGWPGLVEITFRKREPSSPDTGRVHGTYPLEGLDFPNLKHLDDFRVSFS